MLSESVRLTSSYPISGKLLNKGMTRKPRPSREYSWRAIPRYAPHNGLKLGYRVGDAATEKYGNEYEPSQHPNNTIWGFSQRCKPDATASHSV